MTLQPNDTSPDHNDIPSFQSFMLPDRRGAPTPSSAAIVAAEKFTNRAKFDLALEVAAALFEARAHGKDREITFRINPNCADFAASLLQGTGYEKAFAVVAEGFGDLLEKMYEKFVEANRPSEFVPAFYLRDRSSREFLSAFSRVSPEAAQILRTLAERDLQLREEAPAEKLYFDKVVPYALSDIAQQLITRIDSGAFFADYLRRGGNSLLKQLADYLVVEEGLLEGLDALGAFAVPTCSREADSRQTNSRGRPQRGSSPIN